MIKWQQGKMDEERRDPTRQEREHEDKAINSKRAKTKQREEDKGP